MPNTNYAEKFFNLKAECIKSQEISEAGDQFIFHVKLPVTTHVYPICGIKIRFVKKPKT